MPLKAANTDLCNRIRQIREDSQLNQIAFAERLGVGQATISDIERGRREPSKSTCRAIIAEFNINPAWLYEGVGAANVSEPASAYAVNAMRPNLPWDVVKKAVILVETETREMTPISPNGKAALVVLTAKEMLEGTPEAEQRAQSRLRETLASAAEKARQALSQELETESSRL